MERPLAKKPGNRIIEKIKIKYPESVVKERNLTTDPFPHLDQRQIGSWFTPAQSHSPEQAKPLKFPKRLLQNYRKQMCI